MAVFAVVLDRAFIFASTNILNLGLACRNIVIPSSIELCSIGEPQYSFSLSNTLHIPTTIVLARLQMNFKLSIGLAIQPWALERVSRLVREHTLTIKQIILPITLVPVSTHICICPTTTFPPLFKHSLVHLAICIKQCSYIHRQPYPAH